LLALNIFNHFFFSMSFLSKSARKVFKKRIEVEQSLRTGSVTLHLPKKLKFGKAESRE
jgi:hypothetical protein